MVTKCTKTEMDGWVEWKSASAKNRTEVCRPLLSAKGPACSSMKTNQSRSSTWSLPSIHSYHLYSNYLHFEAFIYSTALYSEYVQQQGVVDSSVCYGSLCLQRLLVKILYPTEQSYPSSNSSRGTRCWLNLLSDPKLSSPACCIGQKFRLNK